MLSQKKKANQSQKKKASQAGVKHISIKRAIS